MRSISLKAIVLLWTLHWGLSEPAQAQQAGILREVYQNISGSSVADLLSSPDYPDNPSLTNVVTDFFEAPSSFDDNYGQRMSGFIVPPLTGNYIFWISSDDGSELNLSSNQDPANAQEIASVPGFTGAREWTTYPEQQSAPIFLSSSSVYYIEALMKEGTGGDNLAVRWQLPDGTIEEPIPASRLFLPTATITPPQIIGQPTNVIAVEGSVAVFTVGVKNVAPVSYQWQREGQNIRGATYRSYTNYNVSLLDDGTQYRALVTNALGAVFSSEAVLFVLPDTTSPALQSVFNKGLNTVVVVFSEPMNLSTVSQPSHYRLNNGAQILNATASADGRTVVLETSSLVSGTGYTLEVNGVLDRAATPNPIQPGSAYSFTALDFTPRDIGRTTQLGTLASIAGGVEVVAGGTNIGGISDQFQFSYQERVGDFDVKVRVGSFQAPDGFAEAGLMARENLDVNSRFASILTSPNINGSFFEYRSLTGGVSTVTGSIPVNYPNTWLRLQRRQSLFTGYASFDGLNWTRLGAASLSVTNKIFFGVATASHSTNSVAKVDFYDIADITSGGSDSAVVARTVEPPGPSSRRTGLVISEIMYHPAPRSDGKVLEYVELFNTQPYYEDLSGYRLSGTIDYKFPPGTILQSGALLVVAKQPADVTSIYGITGVLGSYTNSLNNGSGSIRLRNREDAILLAVDYSDSPPWPVAADGAGHSLVLAKPSYGEGDSKAWAASDLIGGSPGRLDGLESDPLRAVVINEFLAHTDSTDPDFIELYNHSNRSIDLSGAILTDNAAEKKFVIPAGTTLSARGFVSFNQNQLGFALSAAGEAIYFVNPGQTRIIDAIRFGPQSNGTSTGRTPDGSATLSELLNKSPGASNSGPRSRDIVINEIMYNSLTGDTADEYIELYNKASNSVNISGWRFVNGIDFTFATNTIVPAGGYLVVAKNAERLQANYSNLNSTNLVGDFDSSLSDSGERITLARPELLLTTNADNTIKSSSIYIVEDEVTYRDGGRWGRWSDGGGSSLELIDAQSDNRLAANWADSDEEKKSPWTNIENTGVLDLGTTAYPIDSIQVLLLGEGECLVDDVEVLNSSGVNMVENSNFEAGLGGWIARGTHIQSKLQNGDGYNSSRSLHIVATARGDSGPNQVYSKLRGALNPGSVATIRAKVRWLKGNPEILFRLHGNYLEAYGNIVASKQLGTPGARNSRAVVNAGPAIYDVTHFPVLPAANEPVIVKAKVHDPDGIASVTLSYRYDPSLTAQNLPMVDDGTRGDEVAGDGIYTATIPGQAAGVMVAFQVRAQDSSIAKAASRFPIDAPTRECLILFGETQPSGGLGTYRIWFTQATLDEWNNRHPGSNEPLDATFVYGDSRVVYNIGTLYSGSPWHWTGYTGPLNGTCNYLAVFPKDDELLGETDFVLNLTSNQGSDPTAIREQTFYWIAEQMGEPYTYRRYHNMFVNGFQRGSIFEDAQQPGREFVTEWFPNDADGELYKIEDWFEYADDALSFQNTDASLQNFVTTGGQKKLARYRWDWRKRAVQDSANDYSELFQLVDAANDGDTDSYTKAVESIVDINEWMRAIASRHVVCDWDSYGYSRGKNMFAYKPQNGKWTLLHWDIAFSFGLGDGPSTDVFSTIEPVIRRMMNHPPFRRLYFQAIQEIVDGPLQDTNINPIIDARWAGLQANGIPVTSTGPVKTFITSRRKYLQQILATNDAPFAITSSGGQSFVSDVPSVQLTGTAPFRVRTVKINGVAYPVNWVTTSNWSLTLPLKSAQTQFVVTGFDRNGHAVSKASDSIVVNYLGPIDTAQDHLVINEIMYNPDVPDTEFVELYNTSKSQSYDLTGMVLHGVDFTFPAGSSVQPQGFVVVVKDRSAFQNLYGTDIPIAGEFTGRLDHGGETLRLVQPGTTPAQDLTIAQVTYDDKAPWPVAADGAGGSLQLIDPSQDNDRVGNWASIGNEWQFVSVTGAAGSSSTLSIQMDQPGDVYIDDISLVSGIVPRVGTNLVKNGDFESPLTGTWAPGANVSESALSNEIIRSGNSSLHFVSSAPGSTVSATSLSQPLGTSLKPGQLYTLSFWYLPSRSGGNLTVKVDGSTVIGEADTHADSLGFSTPGAPNSVFTTLPPFPSLRLNEIEPNNVGGITDRAGERDPWVEIYNQGQTAVNLGDLYLGNDALNPDRWQFPLNAVINPGQYLVVWLDGQETQSSATEWHAGFRAPSSTGVIILSRKVANQIIPVDVLRYSDVAPGRSFGLYPDANLSGRQMFQVPSPGASNKNDAVPVQVFINEWMASNTSTIVNPVGGAYDDWFELYNAGSQAVDLSGYTLTDDLNNPAKWAIPSDTILGSQEFLLVWADEQSKQNDPGANLHANFKLSKGGESIGLFAPNGSLVDAVTFTAQADDVSQGRKPDGASGPAVNITEPSPGASNMPSAEVRMVHIVAGPNAVTFSWQSQIGETYRIQYTDNLTSPLWIDLGSPIPAAGTVTSKTDNMAGASVERYYRVLKIEQ